MKANQLATLVLRLMGIYCLVEVIPVISALSSVIFSGINGGAIGLGIGALATLIAPIIIGVLLITLSVPWGEKLVPKEASEEKMSAISFEQVQVLAFALAGILIFAGALPQLFNSVFNLLRAFSSQDSWNQAVASSYPVHNNPYLVEYAIGTLLKAGLGIWLFFGANGFANFWCSLRNFGTPKPPQT